MKRAIVLAAALLTGCAHRPPAIVCPDVRPTVVRMRVIGPKDMAEADAVRIWHRSGVYRGLTDRQWVDLMILIGAGGGR